MVAKIPYWVGIAKGIGAIVAIAATVLLGFFFLFPSSVEATQAHADIRAEITELELKNVKEVARLLAVDARFDERIKSNKEDISELKSNR